MKMYSRDCRFATRSILAAGAAAAPMLLTFSAPVLAQENKPLEEVVVTAQFSQQQNLQQTPLAITAITGESLTARGVESLSQVTAAAPNVVLDQTYAAFGKSMSAFIRGVGAGDFNFATEPGVGIYVDDVYHATVAGSLFELMDLERVEVLRGPQGTLFGKSSIGGAIRMISAKPKGDNTGYIEGVYGEYQRKDLRAMFDIGITDTLSLRVSGVAKNRQGFVDRIDYVCAHPDLGASQGYPVNLAASRLLKSNRTGSGSCVVGHEGGEDIHGARAALRWKPTDSFEANFTVDMLDDNSEAAPTKLLVAAGNTFAAPGYDTSLLNTYGARFDNRWLTTDRNSNYSTFYNLNTDRSFPAVNATHSWGGSLTLDWDIATDLHLKSISGYRGYWSEFSDDQDATPLPIAYAYNVLDHHQFSQEVQLTGKSFEKFDWATGVFYFKGYSLNRGHISIDNLMPIIPVLDFDQNDPSNITDKAVFAQSTYHATDKLGITAGIRYTKEDKDYTYDHGVLIPRTTRGFSYNHTDWKVGVDYQWTDQLMTYATVSTGFRGGGFNPRPFAATQVTSYGPETLTAYELGLKSEWFDRRLRANVAVFLSKYEDLQLGVLRPDNNGLPYVGISNVGEEEIKGGEVELQFEPIDGLTLNASLGYNTAKYKDLGNAIGCNGIPNPIPSATNPGLFTNCVNGGPLLSDDPSGVKWQGNAGIQYLISLGDHGSITPRIDANFRTGIPTGNSNDLFSDDNVAGYTLYNGRITWASTDNIWSSSLSATNLTNKEYYVGYFNLRDAGEATLSAQQGRPREWAISLRRNFK